MSVQYADLPWLKWAVRPKVRAKTTTRFAPAPTGRLHLGHVANAIFVWALAQHADGLVLLRIEDHDRQRSRQRFESALLDDLDRVGLAADEPTTDSLREGESAYRQSDNNDAYDVAFHYLRSVVETYPCDCTRATFRDWLSNHGAPWSGTGCPGDCRRREVKWRPDLGLRAPIGDGPESWTDALKGPQSGPVASGGDLLVRDRNRNWTYAFCVVVDDLRHGVDLVVRGSDLIDATPTQIRLGRLLGRLAPPTFAHHPLVLRPDGSKLSKADGDTAIGDLLDAGRTPEELFGEAAHRVGLLPQARPISFDEALGLVS